MGARFLCNPYFHMIIVISLTYTIISPFEIVWLAEQTGQGTGRPQANPSWTLLSGNHILATLSLSSSNHISATLLLSLDVKTCSQCIAWWQWSFLAGPATPPHVLWHNILPFSHIILMCAHLDKKFASLISFDVHSLGKQIYLIEVFTLIWRTFPGTLFCSFHLILTTTCPAEVLA